MINVERGGKIITDINEIRQRYKNRLSNELYYPETVGALLNRIDELEKSRDSMRRLIAAMKAIIWEIPDEQLKEIDERWGKYKDMILNLEPDEPTPPEVKVTEPELWERENTTFEDFEKAHDAMKTRLNFGLLNDITTKYYPLNSDDYPKGDWQVVSKSIRSQGTGLTPAEAWNSFIDSAAERYLELEKKDSEHRENLEVFRKILRKER